MKNLIIALSLLFAVGATAQAKKAAPVKKTPVAAPSVAAKPAPMTYDQLAAKNLQDLTAFVSIPEKTKLSLAELFKTKQKMMHDDAGQPLSAERQKVVADIIGRKLEATLDGPTYKTVRENTALFNSLVNM